MKKIIYFLCIMFLSINAKAISPTVDYQENIYSNRIGDKLYSGQMGYIFIDNNISYCMDPFKIVGKTYYENNEFLKNFDSSALEYFEMVSYYGYNINERNNIYYYMAAQELIWEKILGGDFVYWTTGINGTGDYINIDSYKNEIIDNINKFYIKPSFDDKGFSLPFFDENKIYDSNNIFDTYTDYEYNGNNNVIINEKGFNITVLEEGTQTITYSKTIKTDNSTTAYMSDGSQTLISFGLDKTISGGFNVFGRKYYTNLSVVFYDDDTMDIIDNVNFEMISSNELNGEFKNREGIYYYSNEINEGDYKINIFDEYEIVNNNEFKIRKTDLMKDTMIEIYLKKVNNEVEEETIDENNDEFVDNGEENNIIEKPDNTEEETLSDDIIDDDLLIEETVNIKNEILDNNIISDSTSIEKTENLLNIEDDNSIDEIEQLEINNMVVLPNTYNYNNFKYILILIIFIIGFILYEKEVGN